MAQTIEMKETQIENTFTIKLTKTMLNKSTIDASKVVKDWYFYALEGNFGDMLRMEHDEHDAEFAFGVPTKIKFYRTAGRGDDRFWIKGLRKYANEGDYLTVEEAYVGRMGGEGGVKTIIINVGFYNKEGERYDYD